MSISCGCNFETEAGMTCWYYPNDYKTYSRARSKLCNGCSEVRIKQGDTCAVISRYKVPEHDIEIAIHGDDGEIPRASHHLCETCSDMFFTLEELGYCVNDYTELRDDMREAAGLEYASRMEDRFNSACGEIKDCAELPEGSIVRVMHGYYVEKHNGSFRNFRTKECVPSPKSNSFAYSFILPKNNTGEAAKQ